jgi:hypothetical protein
MPHDFSAIVVPYHSAQTFQLLAVGILFVFYDLRADRRKHFAGLAPSFGGVE